MRTFAWVAMTVGLAICAGCSRAPDAAKPTQQKVAHSFNVIKGVNSDGGFLLGGYSTIKDNVSQALAPGAVLVVGVRGGVTLGAQRFDYGAMVLVEGDERRPTYRQVSENDAVELAQEVTVFNRRLPKGSLKIPSGGSFADAAQTSQDLRPPWACHRVKSSPGPYRRWH